MFERVKEIIVDGLGVSADEVVESASFKEDLNADSLDLFELVMTIEEEFGVEVPLEKMDLMIESIIKTAMSRY